MASTPVSGRLDWIDIARGVSIFLVVLGHSTVHEAVITPFSAVRIPLFFLLAGRTLKMSHVGDSFSGQVRSRFRRLMLPYLVCAPAFYVLWYLVGRHFGLQAQLAVPPSVPLVGILYANGTEEGWLVFNIALWFLPALFCAMVFLWAVLRAAAPSSDEAVVGTHRTSREVAAVGVGALLGYIVGQLVFLPWSADVALVVLPFIFGGVLLGRTGAGNRDRPFLSPLAALLAVGVVVVTVLVNGRISVADRHYGVLPLFYAGGFAGTLLIFEAVRNLAPVAALRRPLVYIGRESLMILIFHMLGFQVLSAFVLFGLGISPSTMHHSGWYWVAQVPFGIGFSLVMAAGIKRVPVLRDVFYSSTRPRTARVDAPEPRPPLLAADAPIHDVEVKDE